MPIELSLFLLSPADRKSSARLPTDDDAPQMLDGGGSRLSDALDLAAAFGQPHNTARKLIERNMRAEIEERFFEGEELPSLIALVEDVLQRLPACFDANERPIRPQADSLVSSGVCVESFGRLVLRRTRHGLARVQEDLKAVAHLLSWAASHGWRVICDFEAPET